MITLIILTESIKIGPLLGIGAFVLLFLIMIYQLSKVEHDRNEWRNKYIEKCKEPEQYLKENKDLRKQLTDLQFSILKKLEK